MGVLRYTKSGSNSLTWGTLNASLASIPTGAYTAAFVFKPVWASTGANSDYHGLGYLLSGSGAGVAEAGMSVNPLEQYLLDVTSGSTSTSRVTTNTPYIGVVSKTAGTTAPHFYHYVKSTNTWTDDTGGSTIANQISTTMLRIGAWENADFADMWIGLAAFWSGAMSFADAQTLSTNWRTSDFWSNAHGQPKFLAEMNVAGASVIDLAGLATGLTVVGTSLDAAETLSSFNFNGTGGGSLVSATLSASIGMTGSWNQRAITRTRNASTILVPTLPKSMARVLVSTEPYIATVPRTPGRVMTSSFSLNSTLGRVLSRSRTASTALISSRPAVVLSRSLQSAVSLLATPIRGLSRATSAAFSLSGSLSATKVKLLTLSASFGLAPTMTRSLGRNITATLAWTMATLRNIGRLRVTSVALNSTVSASKVKILELTASFGLSATRLRTITKPVTTVVAWAAAPTQHYVSRILASTMAPVGSVGRGVGRFLSTAVSWFTEHTKFIVPAGAGAPGGIGISKLVNAIEAGWAGVKQARRGRSSSGGSGSSSRIE